jgi:hypothetical protein
MKLSGWAMMMGSKRPRDCHSGNSQGSGGKKGQQNELPGSLEAPFFVGWMVKAKGIRCKAWTVSRVRMSCWLDANAKLKAPSAPMPPHEVKVSQEQLATKRCGAPPD